MAKCHSIYYLLPAGLKSNRKAVAETIENNIRSKIVKEHLNDPAFFDEMSRLLGELIAARKAKAIEYEKYLKRIAELAKRVEIGKADDVPAQIDTPGKRALYNNLKIILSKWYIDEKGDDPLLTKVIEIDNAIKSERPDGWRGVSTRESQRC